MLPKNTIANLCARMLIISIIFLSIILYMFNYKRASLYASSDRNRGCRDKDIETRTGTNQSKLVIFPNTPPTFDDYNSIQHLKNVASSSPDSDITGKYIDFLNSLKTQQSSEMTSEDAEYYDNEFGKTSSTISIGSANDLADMQENCPEVPTGLGPIKDISPTLAVEQLGTMYSDIENGGMHRPRDCEPRQSVAIIVAYSGVKKFLLPFLYGLHPILIKQQLDYQIFIVQQSNSSHQRYNRGKLLNIGFKEAQLYRKDGWNCIIFHELILPLDSRNLYRCGWYPRQLVNAVERPNRPPHDILFGGVIAMTPEQFIKVNGFPNTFWENNADYYDIFRRINASNYAIERNFYYDIGKYRSLKRSKLLKQKFEDITTPSPLYLLDGFSSLVYNVVGLELKRMYTSIQVNLNVNTTSVASVLDKQFFTQLTQEMNSSRCLNN